MKKGTRQIHKQNKKGMGFEPATFRVGGERSPDWATRAFSAISEKYLYIYLLLSSYVF